MRPRWAVELRCRLACGWRSCAGGNEASGGGSGCRRFTRGRPALRGRPVRRRSTAGPSWRSDGTFRVNVTGAPTTWSCAANQKHPVANELDNEGQGASRSPASCSSFTTFLPFTAARTSLSTKAIAIDRSTGAIKWKTKPLPATVGEWDGLPVQRRRLVERSRRHRLVLQSAVPHGCDARRHQTPDALDGCLAGDGRPRLAGQPPFPINRARSRKRRDRQRFGWILSTSTCMATAITASTGTCSRSLYWRPSHSAHVAGQRFGLPLDAPVLRSMRSLRSTGCSCCP